MAENKKNKRGRPRGSGVKPPEELRKKLGGTVLPTVCDGIERYCKEWSRSKSSVLNEACSDFLEKVKNESK